MDDAVNKVRWSADRKTLRIIFLVGDAAPHMDYKDDVKYPVTCKRACEKGIIINAIQCGNSVECMRSNRPAERPGELGTRPRHPAPDCAFRSVGLVDYGNQLEIGLAERHDSVGRAPVWMTATLDRREAVPRRDLAGSLCQIGYRDQHVVELHDGERTARSGVGVRRRGRRSCRPQRLVERLRGALCVSRYG